MKFWFAVFVGLACSALWLGPVDALDAARGPAASSILSADVLAAPPSAIVSANGPVDRPAPGLADSPNPSVGANPLLWTGPGAPMGAAQAIIVTVPPGREKVDPDINPDPRPDEGDGASDGDSLPDSNAARRVHVGPLPATGSGAFTLRLALVAVGLIEAGFIAMVAARRARSGRSGGRAGTATTG